jgi:hypothetical protein
MLVVDNCIPRLGLHNGKESISQCLQMQFFEVQIDMEITICVHL